MRTSSRPSRASGFTVIELLIVIAILTIVAAIAIPKMLSARLAANETSAIATLKAILQAQSQVQSRGAVDTDSDGAGEFAYLGELMGLVPARVSVGGNPGPGVVGVDELEPSPLLQSLGPVQNGVSEHSGYFFQLWLPTAAVGGAVGGLAEEATGGKTAAPFPDSNTSEVMFAAYAWPSNNGRSGEMTFFINQEGVVMRTRNNGPGAYDGLTSMPDFDAALTQPNDLSSTLALNGAASNDGNVWVAVQ